MHTPLLATSDRWPPTRAEGLRRLADFTPRAARVYAAERNYDYGPQQRTNVSTLSPYIRHRAITEEEVLRSVLARYRPSTVEKFVQEVFWRTYWKGWLETHPAAWSRYAADVEDRLTEIAGDNVARAAYERACAGLTGIDAFDAWIAELESEHYVHNHARMWFASIWIFTLRLPWELGADLFMRKLYDGDPASNTLSWRWVAGLHTRGKTYSASRDNIRRYTRNRFAVDAPLVEATESLDDPAIPLTRVPVVAEVTRAGGPSVLVLHDDDVFGDVEALPDADIRAVCALRTTSGRSPLAVDPAVAGFTTAILAEGTARAAARFGVRDLGVLEPDDAAGQARALDALAEAVGAVRFVAPYAPVGPGHDRFTALGTIASRPFAFIGRPYDAASWPAATRGFFNLRTKIPDILQTLHLGSEAGAAMN